MKERRQARVRVMQSLFQADVGGADPERVLLEGKRTDDNPKGAAYAGDLLRGILKNQAEIDAVISRLSQEWALGRMATVDRQILRVGACEILFSEIPAAVAINEAVEIAKLYSNLEGARFINGILGAIVKEQTHNEEK